MSQKKVNPVMRTAILISALLLLLVANVIMMFFAPRGLSEAFQNVTTSSPANTGKAEGFQNQTPGGAKGLYEPIGAFDGVKLDPKNGISSWRATAPNEPLTGPAFEPGPDSLFMFKNNQCKPECCGASFSCDGGCVCTTPDQRQYIASRGGNRTAPEDSA